MIDGVLSPEETAMLRSLLDVVIPPSGDGRLPGAGELDLAAHVARLVQQMPMLRPVLDYGLGTLAQQAGACRPGGWAALSHEERTALLEEFTRSDQFFLPAFLFLVYSGYYQHPRVVAALGLEARPPHPQGYAMAPDDLSLLQRVRARGRLYRE